MNFINIRLDLYRAFIVKIVFKGPYFAQYRFPLPDKVWVGQIDPYIELYRHLPRVVPRTYSNHIYRTFRMEIEPS